MAEPPPTPRWVKVSGIVLGVLGLLFLIVLLTGGPQGHGPGRHSFSIGVIDQARPL